MTYLKFPLFLGRYVNRWLVSGIAQTPVHCPPVTLQGDIILSYSTDIEMEIKYGCYQSYCPEDKCVMNNIGFYAVGETLKDMPIGPLDEYAIVIANTYGK